MLPQSGGVGGICYFVYFIVPVVVFEVNNLFLIISANAIEPSSFEATTFVPDDFDYITNHTRT